MMKRIIKDPAATLDYQMDWSEWLGEDTITASSWTVPPELVQVTHTHTDTAAVVWVSGGAAGSSYNLVNQITTAGGRIDERTLLLAVLER